MSLLEPNNNINMASEENEKETPRPPENRGFATLRRQLNRIFKANRNARTLEIGGSKSSTMSKFISADSKETFPQIINEDFELSQELRVPLNYDYDIDVYNMEKLSVRPSIASEEDLWFHRLQQIQPMTKIGRSQHNVAKLLIVDETNWKEEPYDLSLTATFRRSLRNNLEAVQCLADLDEEIKDMDLATPIGFEYSDRVLFRKFYIAWGIGQLYIRNRKKKEVIQTSIPLAATSFYAKPLPFCTRLGRRLKVCSFSCGVTDGGENYDEKIIRTESKLDFQRELEHGNQKTAADYKYNTISSLHQLHSGKN